MRQDTTAAAQTLAAATATAQTMLALNRRTALLQMQAALSAAMGTTLMLTPAILMVIPLEKKSNTMTSEAPLAERVTRGSRFGGGGHWHAVVDAASTSFSMFVNEPPSRPTLLVHC